ncbi:cytochrome oxidase [Halalkalirubrum salinum]|uniref:cytochrome oxidase n=1 Tax=Halalkalirubrum salinum TaxID=2563889 RepID=UPI0010FB0830|nr:cytochrome oxidase [Halalkalirubrum salinum]
MSTETPKREIDHEEFDPKGTLALILIYFVILSILWVFMYFIEFLGNDLTVIG